MAVQPIDEILLNHIKDQAGTIEHNKKILCILEGELLPLIEAHIGKEFSAQSYDSIRPRIVPINFLKRIISKLSKIYNTPPTRVIVDGSDQDQERIDMYLESFKMNTMMDSGNEMFNAFKNNLMQPYVDDMGNPRMRVIPNDRFYMYSTNPVDQMTATHVALEWGDQVVKDHKGNTEVIKTYNVYSETDNYILDSNGNRTTSEINPTGENPFGTLPFMYANRSATYLNPPSDTDTLRMSILLPVLMSDIAYAVKYQAFSIIYTVNADESDLKLNPNSVWTFKSEPGSDVRPEVGQIKPQVDITETIGLITTLLSMWLNSKNIRPGSVSDISAENMVSGISKLVDEMDTSDERKKQTEIYKQVEERFWMDFMHKIHPVWLSQGLVNPEFGGLFSQNASVEVSFHDQLPMQRRGQVVTDLASEVSAGFLSRISAIRKLNPDWDDKRLEEELELMDQDATAILDDAPEAQDADTGEVIEQPEQKDVAPEQVV